jgi:hypothetical protein
MQRTPVSSSNIRSIGYDVPSATLEVEFTSGDVYQYFDVPEHLHQELMRASSHGGFLNENIVRYNYRYQKVS